MSHESPESGITRESVIEALKTRGHEDEETLELLRSYVDSLHAEAEAVNTNRANIEAELSIAKLYGEAGFPAELAKASLEDVVWTIQNDYNHDHSDLLEEAYRLLDELEGGGGE